MKPINLIFKKTDGDICSAYLETSDGEIVFSEHDADYIIQSNRLEDLKAGLKESLRSHFIKHKLFKNKLKNFMVAKKMLLESDFYYFDKNVDEFFYITDIQIIHKNKIIT